MNLFRSEDHARRWASWNPEAGQGFIALKDLASVFGLPTRRHLLDDDYLSRWAPQRARERRTFFEGIGKATPYWLGS
jgi:hypothetical protein